MKSKKAEELIEKYAVGNSRDAAPTMMKRRVVECIELAEHDAEERMREKAIEAFCMDCICASDGKHCSFGDDCAVKVDFIQKLNEE
jgi:hypothetical protein